jgi:exopolysaccharide biosynthesis predicted pyruvyltransferase EpsI
MSGQPPGTIAMPPGEFLPTLSGRRVFFDALYGNHGDRLLTLAAEALIARAGITPVRTARSAEFILVNGGGGMADGWSGLDRLARYCRSFPAVPLAVLPSSFRFEHSSLSDLCRLRRAELWLWARERPSFDLLRRQQASGCRFHAGLDHDLAFALRRHPLIEELRSVTRPGHVLVVERDDWEGPTGRTRPLAPPGLGFIPESVRNRVRRALVAPLRRRQDRTSGFCRTALAYARQRHPKAAGLPPVTADISLAETCDFAAFLRHVAGAAVIVTTRLHVAILGQLLEIPTYLVEGRYHKYRGVFAYSMQGATVELVAWDGARIVSPLPAGAADPAVGSKPPSEEQPPAPA